jgi:hypothetical protein
MARRKTPEYLSALATEISRHTQSQQPLEFRLTYHPRIGTEPFWMLTFSPILLEAVGGADDGCLLSDVVIYDLSAILGLLKPYLSDDIVSGFEYETATGRPVVTITSKYRDAMVVICLYLSPRPDAEATVLVDEEGLVRKRKRRR